jgi:hypothetical protein
VAELRPHHKYCWFGNNAKQQILHLRFWNLNNCVAERKEGVPNNHGLPGYAQPSSLSSKQQAVISV